MNYYDYDINSPDSYYYEKLQSFIEDWESEVVEFKEAKGGYDTDKLPDSLSDKQKKDKIRNILQSMRRAGTIVPDSQNKQTTNWVLL